MEEACYSQKDKKADSRFAIHGWCNPENLLIIRLVGIMWSSLYSIFVFNKEVGATNRPATHSASCAKLFNAVLYYEEFVACLFFKTRHFAQTEIFAYLVTLSFNTGRKV